MLELGQVNLHTISRDPFNKYPRKREQHVNKNNKFSCIEYTRVQIFRLLVHGLRVHVRVLILVFNSDLYTTPVPVLFENYEIFSVYTPVSE